jgi:hypothetical protein
MNDERLDALIDRHLDGEMTASERAELEARLRNSAADRARFWQRAETHVVLHESLQRETVEIANGSRRGEEADALPATPVPPPHVGGYDRHPSFSWQRRAWQIAAAAACIAVGMTLLWHRAKPASPTVAVARLEVAVVQQTAGARWRNGEEPRAGDRLQTGALRLETGLVRLRFLSGASVVLQGPAELEIKSASVALVTRGRVIATVPPVAEGFTLLTEGWRLIDRGTVFGVSVPDDGKAELHVLSGKVDVQGATVARSLRAGQAAQLGLDGALTELPAAPETFPTERDVFARAATQQSQRLIGWRESSRRAATDASLVLFYDFENADRDLGVIRNLAPAATQGSDGVLVGGEWTEGRWPGKNAVQFRRVGDLIRTLPLLKLATASCVAWVRFDAGFDQRQTLLLSPKVGPGQVYWLVWPEPTRGPAAALAFVKTDQAGRDRHALAHGTLSPSVVGRWLQLAVVADAARGKVSHYLNGARVSEQDFGDSLAMDLNELVIGNWGYTREPSSFVGRMDELAIYRRALAAEELSRLYNQGKP